MAYYAQKFMTTAGLAGKVQLDGNVPHELGEAKAMELVKAPTTVAVA